MKTLINFSWITIDGFWREEFNDHWLIIHAPMSVKFIPDLNRYVQNHFVKLPDLNYEGDGIVETWWDDLETWQDSMKKMRTTKELMADGPKFYDGSKDKFWVVQEHVILDRINE